MYIAKRREKAIETFALADENGDIIKEFPVNCDPEQRLIEYNRAKNKVIAAEALLDKDPNEESYEKYGKTLLDMLGIFFGDNAIREILDFFEGNYSEMILEIIPFIRDVVEPRMREISDKQMAELKKRK